MKINNIKRDLDAWEEYQYWYKTDKANFNKINKLVKEIVRAPYQGTGKPEPLKNNLSGLWSRRIDKEHRIVYLVENDCLVIFQCKGHYN